MPGLGYWPMRTKWGEAVCKKPGCKKEFTKLSWNQEYCITQHGVDHANQLRSEHDKAERKARKLHERECV